METSNTKPDSTDVLLNNYGRLPITMSHGLGSEIWDIEGKRYIDLFAGFGGCGVSGHSDPRIVDVLKKQAEKLLCHGNFFSSEPQILLAEKIIKHSFDGRVFFCHSGAEANEAAIKLVRKAAGAGRHKIICFENCFHGRTMGALSITPESFQSGFEPMLEGAIRVPFNDIDAVRSAVDAQTAAVFIEPIQGEGGINIPDISFMKQLRDVCDENNLLLVCDEVWTAPARTGKWFAYQLFGIEPDAMTCAKAIGGGAPLAALVVADKWKDVLGPGTHGCTMGGNPLCASVALRSLQIIEEENLCDRAIQLGELCKTLATSANLNCITDIRGSGLMIAYELSPELVPMEVVKKCLGVGVSIAPGKNNTIRIAPPLTIDETILKEGLQLVLDLLRQESSQ